MTHVMLIALCCLMAIPLNAVEADVVRPPAWAPLNVEWTHALGDPAEGLNTSLARLPERREPVALPHRTLHPDTPYWYVADAVLAVPTVLRINADDGAQVWVNGRRVRIKDGHFRVRGSSRPSRIVIRVINKAVYGGLNAVAHVAATDFDRWLAEQRRTDRIAALIRKAEKDPDLPPDLVRLCREAELLRTDEAIERAERAAAGYPTVTVGPVVHSQTAQSATIWWETDHPCRGEVHWRVDGGTWQKTPSGPRGTLHRRILRGLMPGARVMYRIMCDGREGAEHSFTALPADGSFTFAAWADSQNRWTVFRSVVEQMRLRRPAFHVGIGDMVEDGWRKEPWAGLFHTLGSFAAETPTFLLGGNHEYDGLFEDLRCSHLERYVPAQPASSHYAWTAGCARFVALDPNRHFPTGIPAGSAEREWLIREMSSREWRQARWRFLFIHQPPYSQGWPMYQGDLPIRDLVEEVAVPHGVDFVVSGHTHDYERLSRSYGARTVHYMIIGGAGGGLENGHLEPEPVMDKVIRRHHFAVFTVSHERIEIEAVAPSGEVLDRFQAQKP